MLTVGFGLMLAAFTAFVLWNVYMKCRTLWRERQARQRKQIDKPPIGKPPIDEPDIDKS